jgi:hypothetical protein
MSDASASPLPGPRPASASRVVAVATAAAVLALYGATLSAPYVFDDLIGIVQNAALRSGDVWLLLRQLPNRILPGLTWLASFRAADGVPPPLWLHALALASHVGAFFVARALAIRLFRRFDAAARAEGAGTFTAAVFALHPLQTQSVAYAWQMPTIWSGGLCLTAWLFLEKALERDASAAPGARRDRAWRVAAYLTFLAACFSKPNAVGFVGLVAIRLLFETKAPRRLAGELAPWIAVAALAALPLLVADPLELSILRDAQRLGTGLSHGAYVVAQISVLVYYVRLVFLPLGQSIDHVFLARGALDPVTVACGLALALAAAAAFALRRRAPLVTLGAALFLATVGVESFVAPLEDLAVEHRTYLVVFAVALAAAAGAARLATTPVRLRAAQLAAAAVLVALALTTRHRLELWRAPLALWSDALAKAPEAQRPLIGVGRALFDLERYPEAAEHLSRAASAGPRHRGLALFLLAISLGRTEGKDAEAEAAFAAAAADGYDTAEFWRNYAVFYALSRRLPEARDKAKEALARDPEDVETLLLLARVQIDLGLRAEGLATYGRLLDARRPGADGLYEAAYDLFELADFEGAARAAAAWRAREAAPTDAKRLTIDCVEAGLARERGDAAPLDALKASAVGARLQEFCPTRLRSALAP